MFFKVRHISYVAMLLFSYSFDSISAIVFYIALAIRWGEIIFHYYFLILEGTLLCLYINVVPFTLFAVDSFWSNSGFSGHLQFTFDLVIHIVSDIALSYDSFCSIPHKQILLSFEYAFTLLDPIIQALKLFVAVHSSFHFDMML